jgi:hypothetical protein
MANYNSTRDRNDYNSVRNRIVNYNSIRQQLNVIVSEP